MKSIRLLRTYPRFDTEAKFSLEKKPIAFSFFKLKNIYKLRINTHIAQFLQISDKQQLILNYKFYILFC